jgi:uncharacterized protein (TIGR00269 family)
MRLTKCDKCPGKAVIYQRYSGMSLCRSHFEEDVHRKIRESLRQSGLFARGACVALGLDGKMGSAALAYVLKNLFIRRKDIDLVGVILDEGWQGHSSLAEARLVAERLEIPYVVRKLPPLDLASTKNAPQSCRICSAQRVEQLFAGAKETGAGILATGHNLDDEALDVFVNLLEGRLDALSRARALSGRSHAGQIPWIKPLRRVPEEEVLLYALGRDLYSLKMRECPYADGMRRAAKRQLAAFDLRHPGTKYSLLRSLEKVATCIDGAAPRAKPLSDGAK